MEYKVIMARGAHDLEKLVQEAIQQGWEPLGGIAVQKMRDPRDNLDTHAVLFAQAVVLKA